MATVYVREQGAVVRKRGERLVVTKHDREIMEIPLIHVDQVVLLGNVQLTTPAVALLLEHNVDVVFFTRYGKFRGCLVQTGSKFAELRHRQLRALSNKEFALALAKGVVRGKLANQRVILLRQIRNRLPPPQQAAVERAIMGIQSMMTAATGAATVETLRGFEGRAGAFYFDAYRALVPPEFGFRGRAYHPPPDPVNALLSFGYTLLLKDVTAAVQLVGLDPYLGFFHAIEYGRPSLALDVMEEFRPLIVDAMVLELLHKGEVGVDDFVWRKEEGQPVELRETAVRVLIERYEQRMLREVFHPVVRQRTTYRRCVELQVRQIAQIVLGKRDTYRPLIVR